MTQVKFDGSGSVVTAASDDGTVIILAVPDLKPLGALKGHEDAVQAVVWENTSKSLISASSDCTFRLWTTN